MIVPLAFWLFLFGALALGWQAGDHRDRKVLLAVFGAVVFTALARTFLAIPQQGFAVIALNLALLLIVWRYAENSPRHWPLWFAGFQLASCAFGILSLILPPGFAKTILSMSAAFWSIPALVVMVVGLLSDRRQKIANP